MKPLIPKHLADWAAREKARRETKYKHAICVEWFRKLTFLERLKLLFGANLLVRVVVCTRKMNLGWHPVIVGDVTEYTTPTDQQHAGLRKELAKHLEESGLSEFDSSRSRK